MVVGSSRPLLTTVGWALGAYVVVVGIHAGIGSDIEFSLRAIAVALAGVLYTNLFEHAWHRYGMHGRRPDPRHAQHHRVFYGEAFRTRDPRALLEIVTSWYIFPSLLAAHYPVFAALFSARLAPAFFLGVVLHFAVYEVTHWYTHVADNMFDRVLDRIPGVGQLRAMQIRHHRLHHAEPMVNFNFNPPYAGDRLAGVLRR
jgi:hypothetical protein